MKNFVRISCLFAAVAFLSGCLTTRQQLRDQVRGGASSSPSDSGSAVSAPATTQQEANAAVQLQEVHEEMRSLLGRLEVLEANNDPQRKSEEEAQKEAAVAQKFALYQQALEGLEKKVLELSERLTALKASKKSAGKSNLATDLSVADKAFEQKKWKAAILGYQAYCEKYPKGKSYVSATYKIGVSFQELGMVTEAKSFYEEIVEKYPKSRTAKKARYRLKSLKK